MLFWLLQRQLTKNRLKPMKPRVKVCVLKVSLNASLVFSCPEKYLFGVCSISQRLQKSQLCSSWSCCCVDGARLSS